MKEALPDNPSPSIRTAVVDCGTNMFSMLIADVSPSGWESKFILRRPVFLGQGGFQSRIIVPDRFARGLDALRVLHQAAVNYGVEKVRVVGTSALRDAMNGEVFVKSVEEALNWKLEIIDGEQEARWINQGVALTLTAKESSALVMDIGGGSVEFILTNREPGGQWAVQDLVSLNVGVARLAEFGKPADPLTAAGEERYREFLEDAMAPVRRMIAAHSPVALVGSSGSFDTFSEMINGPVPRDLSVNPTQIQSIDSAAWKSLHHQLIETPVQGRLKLQGMAPDPARMIPLSSMLVNHVWGLFPAQARLIRSPFAMREGIMNEIWQHLCTRMTQE